MQPRLLVRLLGAALLSITPAAPALAQHVNVTPKRLMFDEQARDGQEIIVFNRGDETATFKLELVDRLMKADGSLDETAAHVTTSARTFVRFTPRRVSLAPGESQVVRVHARPPANLPPGEYRAHLNISAIPAAAQAGAPASADGGIKISLTPIYGMSIPVIVRRGPLQAQVAIQDVRATQANGAPAVSLVLARAGDRSAYGDLEVQFRDGRSARTVAVAKGVGVYPETATRAVVLPLRAGAPALRSGARLRLVYRDDEAGGSGRVLAETEAVLP